MDPNALNYDPKAKKDGNCLYDELIIIDSTPEPYCDVPTAVNYETHDKEDTSYQASASVCNFCGNNTTDGGKTNDDGSVESVEFT
jgi:hypothetical protein